ncbi:MAG: hypothetical protein OHK0023_28470 [Anaerolineae bacterium]
MRRAQWVIVFLMLTLVIVLGGTVQAQSAIRYAVAYGGGQNGDVIVAALQSDNTWRFTTVEGSYFGQGDVALLQPVWSPQGTLFAVGQSDISGEEHTQLRRIYRYDLADDTAKMWVDLPKSNPYSVMVISVSPDGRFLFASDLGSAAISYLVDTQSGKVLQEFPECYKSVLFWTEEYILTQDAMCPYTVRLFQLTNGKELVTLPEEQAQPLWYPDWLVQLNPTQILGLLDSRILSVITLPDLTLTGIAEGVSEAVIADKQRAVYGLSTDLSLHSLDLATLQSTLIGNYRGELLGGFAEGELVYLWQRERDADQTILSLLTIDGQSVSAKEIYRGELDNSMFAPDYRGVAIRDAAEVHSVLPGRDGTLISPPDSGSDVTSISPDGQWALISVPHPDEIPQDMLYALEIATGKRVDFPLASGLPERNFHFEPYRYYVWFTHAQDK